MAFADEQQTSTRQTIPLYDSSGKQIGTRTITTYYSGGVKVGESISETVSALSAGQTPIPSAGVPVPIPETSIVTQPISRESAITQLQLQQAGLLPDTIFGVKTSYLLIAGLIGGLFLMKRTKRGRR